MGTSSYAYRKHMIIIYTGNLSVFHLNTYIIIRSTKHEDNSIITNKWNYGVHVYPALSIGGVVLCFLQALIVLMKLAYNFNYVLINSYQHYSIIFPNEGRSSHYNMQHYLNYKVALNYNFVYYLIEPWSIRPIPHLHRRAGILLIRGGVYTGMYS